MKFDNIFGNPPYQDNIAKGKTQHKTWISFTIKSVEEWCNEGGFIGWVTPQSWASPSNKVLEILKNREVPLLSMDTKQFFTDIGSTFSHYGIINSHRVGQTTIINSGNKYDLLLNERVLYIPNDFCELSYNIHKKVIFDSLNKLDVMYDYVTCHNVIRHAEYLRTKKIESLKKKILQSNNSSKIAKLQASLAKLLTKEVDISVSEVKTEKHIHPILHTNGKTWYSSIRQNFANNKKVMWSRSGYTKPFYDNGVLGCTDLGYYTLVETAEQGKRLQFFLNSRLMQYIFKTAKWSGFGNEKVFLSLPKIDLTKDYTETEIYSLFSLSDEEILYINSGTKKGNSKTKSESKSSGRIKEYGEVFTPVTLVREVLSLLPIEKWKDPKQTFLDPSCGNGNFLIEIYKKRIENGIEPIQALSTLFGIDIMQDNIRDAKKRLLEIAYYDSDIDSEIIERIINKNLTCQDSLSFDVTSLLDENLT